MLAVSAAMTGCNAQAAVSSIAEFKIIEKIPEEELKERAEKIEQEDMKKMGEVAENPEETKNELPENSDFVPLNSVYTASTGNNQDGGYRPVDEVLKESKEAPEDSVEINEEAVPTNVPKVEEDMEDPEDSGESDPMEPKKETEIEPVVSNYIYQEDEFDFLPIEEFKGYITKNTILTKSIKQSTENIPAEKGETVRVYGSSDDGDYYIVSYGNHGRLFVRSDRISKKEIKKEVEKEEIAAEAPEKKDLPVPKEDTPASKKETSPSTPAPQPKQDTPKPKPAPTPTPPKEEKPKIAPVKKTVVVKTVQAPVVKQEKAPAPIQLNPAIPFPVNPENVSINLGVSFADENFIAKTIASTRVSSGPGTVSNSTGYHELTVLATGSVVNATGIGQNGYVRITLSDGRTGFVDSRYLAK